MGGCHQETKRWAVAEERPLPRNRIKATEQKFRGAGRKKRTEEGKLKEELKLLAGKAQIVLRFLGTGEQFASAKELIGLSSQVLLSFAGWIRSFGNQSKELEASTTASAQERPRWMRISSLDELKTKLGHVIVMILLVKMFERSKTVMITSGMDLLSYAMCIFLSSASLFVLHNLHK